MFLFKSGFSRAVGYGYVINLLRVTLQRVILDGEPEVENANWVSKITVLAGWVPSTLKPDTLS